MGELEGILARIQAIDQRLAVQPTPAERTAALERLRAYWTDSDGAWLLEQANKHELNAALHQLDVCVLCEDRRVVEISLVG